MSGCSYCEDGEGAELIAYAREIKPLLTQLLYNHQRRTEGNVGSNEAYSALSVVNALKLKLKVLENVVEKGESGHGITQE
jgi:hypothetical protein